MQSRALSMPHLVMPLYQVKNERGALASITQQFAKADKWQAELSMRDQFLHEKVWNGQALYPLRV
eukprot:9788602-Ditylum_brightwellii.AAC.2